ncbi:DUF4446 family protein [Paenibacillus oryzisoli]|uniref:DUF4446 family protein n=1 Tax=Paenibacillus oryzisoli TaxID=1850517 RepID=UPI003D28ACF3
MGELFGWDAEVAGVILLACMALILVLFIFVIIISARLSKLRKLYTRMMNGSSADNVEQLIGEMQEAINAQKAESQMTSAQLVSIREIMAKMKSNVSIHRYNAFGDRGSDLSFSLAILDDEQDGIVMTGIHSREQMYVYAKPVEKGQSTYTLSPEEKEAITRTSHSKQA